MTNQTSRTYTAVFSDGSIATRKSKRPLTHAYRAYRPNVDPAYAVGFGTSAEKAKRTGRGCLYRGQGTVEVVEAVRS